MGLVIFFLKSFDLCIFCMAHNDNTKLGKILFIVNAATTVSNYEVVDAKVQLGCEVIN